MWHHARAADHLKVSNFRQIREHFAVYAAREDGVLLLRAQVLKRKHGYALRALRGRFRRGLAQRLQMPLPRPDSESRADDQNRHRRCYDTKTPPPTESLAPKTLR